MSDFNLKDYPENQGQRLDLFLAAKLDLSRSRIKQLIESASITLNNKSIKASHMLGPEDTIQIALPPSQKLELTPIDLELDIIYEDDDVVLINKPIGMTVHPGAGTGENTLVHGLLHHCKNLSGIGGVERPGIIHRLDKDTSGIILIAKNDLAHQHLTRQFKERTITKIYLALIEGRLNQPAGEINLPIGRHPAYRQKMMAFKNIAEAKLHHARSACTRYHTLTEKNNKTLLEVQLLTGRTHQIRVHLAAIGHPIIGDPIYNHKPGKQQLLHAYRIKFCHPRQLVDMEFTASPPGWTKSYLTL